MSCLHRVIFAVLLISSVSYASTSGDSSLSLWQVAYKATTRYDDGYTVRGKAKSFQGSFRFENGKLLSLEGVVPVASLNSGLSSRDASIRELLFQAADGSIPDLAFKSEPSTCEALDKGWVCQVKGAFKIREEWQPVAGTVHISDYQGRTWLHAEGTLRLSQFAFYATSSAALKVADQVDVVLDLLGE